ncbi:alpha/beta-hydrolase [Xylariaceae sp. FL0804]|nr:alpha/beta-hydrolase [Xylariaceae sp. FL0804]
MPTRTDPVVLIIGGGWHGPDSYSKLAAALEATGLEVHVPELPTLNGAVPPTKDLADDTAFIRAYAERLIEGGRTVIAVMHSYGGQVGTNALAGLGQRRQQGDSSAGGSGGGGSGDRGGSGRVGALVYMTASAMPEGTSMLGKVREMGGADRLPEAFDFRADGTVATRAARPVFLNDWDEDRAGAGAGDEAKAEAEAEAVAYLDGLRTWSARPMDQRIERCAWREVPVVVYIVASRDVLLPPSYQTSMIDGMRAEGVDVVAETVDAGHCPNFTRPAEVAEIVKRVADGL